MKRFIDKLLWNVFGILRLQPTPEGAAFRAQVIADHEAAKAQYNAYVAELSLGRSERTAGE